MKKLILSLFALLLLAPQAFAGDCFEDPIYDRDWNAVVTTGMRVRDVACMEGSAVLGTVPVGEVVHVIGETDGWYKVQTKDGIIGWSGQWLLEQTNLPFNQVSTPASEQKEEEEAPDPLFDIGGHKYESAIRYLEENEIISGYPDGSYKPENSVNRAEFTKIIVGAKLGTEPADSASNCFPDVKSSDWFASYVCYAKNNGIIAGYPDGTFKPANTINLAEAAKILVNTLDVDLSEDDSGLWYAVFIRSLQNSSYIPDTFASVADLVNRGQMAELVYRILEKVNSKPAKTFAETDLTNSSGKVLACADTEAPSNVNMDTARSTWFSWVNSARTAIGRTAYSESAILDATAQSWSDYSSGVGVMSHSRPGQTEYYDYALITSWFENLGVTFKNKSGWTYSENIGRTYLNCTEEDCTQELIDATKLIFDAYMAEKGTSYTAHYDSVMSPQFTLMGVAWAFKGKDVYVTVHYAAELDRVPILTCQ